MRQLLDDVSVLEVAVGSVAASYCGKLLADQGADVIKVEPPGGDPLRVDRRKPDRGESDSTMFLHLNTNKRSIVIDPDIGAGTILDLLSGVDLIIESEREGALARWGFTWEQLHDRYPQLTLVSVTTFGVVGPYKDYRSEDIVAQAFAGNFAFQEGFDQDPLRLPGNTTSYLAGNMASLGALASVTQAKLTGIGTHIDSAAVEALATIPPRGSGLVSYHYSGGVARTLDVSSDTVVPMGVYPCADGYVAIVTMIQQLTKLIDLLDDDALRRAFEDPDALKKAETREVVDAAFYPWLLARTREEATSAAQAIGFPLTAVLSPREVFEADHFWQRGFWTHVDHPTVGSIDIPGPPFRHQEGGWAFRRPPPLLGQHTSEVLENRVPSQAHKSGSANNSFEKPVLPLEGVRVVDMTAVFAGPFVTMLLADLGAEVIRVENPWIYPPSTKGFQPRPVLPPELQGKLGSQYGPKAEGRPDRPYNRHAMNNSVARNKLSCTIDIRQPEGRDLFLRLVDMSDVFVESFKSTSMASMGLYTDELKSRNSRLIVTRIPPTGLTGAWSKWTGFGQNFDALSGLISVSGHRNTTPVEAPGIMHMDGVTGPAVAFSILAALHYRSATGRGQTIEAAQLENVIQHLGEYYLDLQFGIEPELLGNRHAWRAPQGLYKCTDRWLAISIGEEDEWRGLANVMRQPELATQPRFATLELRRANHDELDKIISSWAEHENALDTFHSLQGAGVPAGPLLNDEGFTNDRNIVARKWFRPLSTTDIGSRLQPGHPYSGLAQVWRRGSPSLGEDNEYVYKKILGVTEEEFEFFQDRKILAEDYLDKRGQPY